MYLQYSNLFYFLVGQSNSTVKRTILNDLLENFIKDGFKCKTIPQCYNKLNLL